MTYRKNIAIIGLFTSFNIETALVVADNLGLHFLDANRCIEYNVTYPIREIIEEYGIDYYLKCEKKIYRELSEFEDISIGVSSSALIDTDNIRNLSKTCYMVYMQANEESTLRRFRKDPENYLKELILNDYKNIIDRIEREIKPLCDVIIDTDRMTPVRVAGKAINELAKLAHETEANV